MNRHWALKLGDICEIVSGATPKTGVKAYWDGDIPWVTPADLSSIEGHYLSDTPRKITAAGLANSSARMLPANSVLLSSRAPIGHIAINSVPMATNQGFKSLVPKEGLVDSKFLYHWLSFNKARIQALGNGATFKEISKATVAEIGIDLPPIEDQRRIAAILDKADALRQKRKRAIALLDSLTQSIFLEMFGSPKLNPKRWEVVPFGQAVKSEDYRRRPLKSADRDQRHGSFPYYGASGIIDYIDEAIFSGRYLLIGEDGANLLSRSSDIAFIAEGDFWVNNHAHVLSDNGVTNLEYLRSLILQTDLTPYVTGSAQPKLNQSKMDSIPVMLPARSLQDEFEQRVVQCRRSGELQSKSLTYGEHIFASLQHRAFSGQL